MQGKNSFSRLLDSDLAKALRLYWVLWRMIALPAVP